MRRLARRLLLRVDLSRVLLAVAVVVPVLLFAAMAFAARPGGGGSYSGGSSGSSGGGGGGGDGGGELLGLIIMLCFDHPAIGFPLLILFIVVAIWRARSRARGNEWSTHTDASWPVAQAAYVQAPPAPRGPVRQRLANLQRTDPAFSLIVFEDFLYFLYAEMHRARGASAGEALAPYVSSQARAMLRNDGRLKEVTGIVIGAMSYESVIVEHDGSARVFVSVESNYVERYGAQGEQRFYVKERLSLTRAAGAKSRPPDKARVLNCPNCGGPLSAVRGSVCSYCNTQIVTGQRDWAIDRIEVLEREPRGPLLTSSVEEQGTNLPTVVDPQARAVIGQILTKDAGFQWARFEQRIRLIFEQFHAGWVGRDPALVRPFVSDNLFQSQVYWIDLYRAARCVNRTDGARITAIELAAATTDAYFDAICVRVYATGCDFTVSEDGRVLSGSPNKPRPYSEYWTLIRGARKKPTDKGDRQCPNCGAPLAINMTGNCTHCGVKVTSGEYDWVLSRIEQDEAYRG